VLVEELRNAIERKSDRKRRKLIRRRGRQSRKETLSLGRMKMRNVIAGETILGFILAAMY
jgi:hypothetical protein